MDKSSTLAGKRGITVSKNPWLHAECTYEGGTLVLMKHQGTGKETVLYSRMGEVKQILWSSTVNRLVQTLRADLARSEGTKHLPLEGK